eukprot:CAMPEP_0204084310 /NCGR_PEP_ID=MMETSP0360-20130528/179919_1 /ASSEMBLY_ACC=CAM_ASM_000342 /TAXON_ID=268821 /ORGANISM="Scrippsiella Hangoei, Strain SHTV-5" /LENGTH=68 /DNA_ID=CAMNT_0051033299 /DNA_START=55 /DNA_END=261 /DNA_ORIENTATION=+
MAWPSFSGIGSILGRGTPAHEVLGAGTRTPPPPPVDTACRLGCGDNCCRWGEVWAAKGNSAMVRRCSL